MMRASSQDRARQLVDELAGQGATFTYKAASGTLPASFTYEMPRGGNRQACRALIAGAKGDPILWSAIVAEIGFRCSGGAS